MKINELMSSSSKKKQKVKTEDKKSVKILKYSKWFFLIHGFLYLFIAYILPVVYPEDCENPSISYDIKCYLAYG